MDHYPLQIGGSLVNSAATIDVFDPATGSTIATCARALADHVELAIASAKAAFPAWTEVGYEVRRAKLLYVAKAIQAQRDEFARLLSTEQGKPFHQAVEEVDGTIAMFNFFASMEMSPRVIEEGGGLSAIEHFTPLGVVVAITPWNYPLIILAVKIVPALLVGNTVIAKPAPTTPLTTLKLGEICAELLPPGVFNVLVGMEDLGKSLTNHPDVAKISFTGSTQTGKKVMESAASGLKRITLELGGNDAAIVLDDANVSEVAPKIFNSAMLNAGQVCVATKRVYVHESQYDAMCEALVGLAEGAVVGAWNQDGVQIGPIQNRAQYDRVRALIAETRAVGKIIAGDRLHDGPGYFIYPTIVRDIADNARLVCEEQFGPVLPVLCYKTVEEVIGRVNDSDYGLAGSVWTSNPDRGRAVAMKIDSGRVWVNTHMQSLPNVSAGGSKQSGIGVEMGLEGVAEYTQRHVVYVKNG